MREEVAAELEGLAKTLRDTIAVRRARVARDDRVRYAEAEAGARGSAQRQTRRSGRNSDADVDRATKFHKLGRLELSRYDYGIDAGPWLLNSSPFFLRLI